MKFNKHPWTKHFNNEYKFTFDENLNFKQSFIRKESLSPELKTVHGNILFEGNFAYFTGEWQEENLALWHDKFLSWENVNYKNIYEFLINEYRELDNEIFFREFDIDFDINLSEVNEYIPQLENKGLVFDFRRFQVNDNINDFVLEDCDDSILIIPLSQRKLENRAYIAVNNYITKVDYIEAQTWMANILLGYIMTIEENENEINHIIDFFNSKEIDRSQIALTSYKEIVKRADKWIHDFNKKIKDKVGEESVDYRTLYVSKNGYILVKLLSEDAKKLEGKQMDNCIGRLHLDNENLYSIRSGIKIVASLDIRTNAKGYFSKEIKGPENRPVHVEHREDVIECLLNYFNIDIDESNDLHNVGLFKNNLGLNHPKYTIPDQQILLKLENKLSSSIYEISFCTEEEINSRVQSVIESIRTEQHQMIYDVFNFFKTETHVKNIDFNIFVSKEDDAILRDFSLRFSPVQMELIISNSKDRKKIVQHSYSMHTFKIFGREIQFPVKSSGLMYVQDYNGFFLTKEELFKKKEHLKSMIEANSLNILKRIDEMYEEFIAEAAVCPFSNILIKKEQKELVNHLYSFESENPSLFKAMIYTYRDSYAEFLKSLFGRDNQELGGEKHLQDLRTNLYYQSKSILENNEVRAYAYKIAKIFNCHDHVCFYSFFKKEKDWRGSGFEDDKEMFLDLLPESSSLFSLREELNELSYFNGDRWVDNTKEHSSNSTKLEKPQKCLHCSNYSLYEDQDSVLGDIDVSISEINPMAKEYMNLYNQLEKEYKFIDSSLGKLTDSMLPLFKSLVDVEIAKIKPRTVDQKNALVQAIRTSLESINQDIKQKNDEGVSHIEIEIQRMLGNADDIDSRISDIESDSKKFEKITGEECTYCQGHEVIDENSRALDINCQDNINYRSRDKDSLNKVADGYYNIKIDVEEFINQVNEYWSKIEEEHKL